MASTYLTTDGDINQAKRKRAGEGMGIDALPGDPARAARMQAQFDQPVTVGDGGAGGGGIGGAVERLKGAYTAVSPLLNPVATVAGALTATPADALRNSVIRAAGGDPATAEGGETANRDQAFSRIMPAVDAVQGASNAIRQGISGGILSATGATPVQPAMPARPAISAAPVSAPATPAAKAEAPAQAAPQAAPDYMKTGIGGDRAGGEIVGRRGTGGVMEFTNENATPGSVASAAPMPEGGIGGRGTFSQMQAGDSALAMGRFERANQEREKMVQISRRGGIGEGGGRVTVVRDSSRAPSIAELLNARLASRETQDATARAQAQQSIMSGADELMTNQLNRQKTQQELDAGQVGLESQQRLAKLGAMMADPNLGTDQRQAARDAYTSLSTPAKDRYQSQDIIIGRDENGRDIRGSQLIDVTTGRPVMGIGDQVSTQKPAPAAGDRQGGYEFLGGDPSDQKNWRKV